MSERGAVKRVFLAFAFWCLAFCVPASAKTFVGVLWPMFGPLPAIGLVELVAELRLMPDVEVHTYLHQEWPSLVDDLNNLPPGTPTVVVGYSLGANSTVFVANKAKYIDVIIALQPSMLSWNPTVTGRVGRMIEVYNPNPSMTFGGMGSKKLIGPNIEYIANNDSHPGAQFNSDFRDLVKSEIARVSTEPAVVTAQGRTPTTTASMTTLADANPTSSVPTAQARTAATPPAVTAEARSAGASHVAIADVPIPAPKPAPKPSNSPVATKLATIEPHAPIRQREDAIALLDAITSAVDSGNLFGQRQLTIADMMDHANKSYRAARTAELAATSYDPQ
jgi:hypothetical protein